MIEQNPDYLANVAVPVGTVQAFGWDSPENTGRPDWSRYFDGTLRWVDLVGPDGRHVECQIEGVQLADGSVTREIRLRDLDPDKPLSVSDAAALVQSLTEAITECHTAAEGDADGSSNHGPDPEPVLLALNAYQGGSIWRDVIVHLPDFEPDATAALPPLDGHSGNRFIADRVEYRYLPFESSWVAWQRTDIMPVIL